MGLSRPTRPQRRCPPIGEYGDDLEGEVFITDSEQEATARFDAWMNGRKGKGVLVIKVFDHNFGSNIYAITVIYRKSP